MKEIAPSILSVDFAHLKEEMIDVKIDGTDYIIPCSGFFA